MNEELRQKLIEMKAEDLRVREELAKTGELFDGYAPRMEQTHLKNAAELERMLEENGGWLGKSLVGEDSAEAAWLIVQHAISLPEFQRKCLKLIEEAVENGEAEAWQAAFLDDRICFFEGRPQRYGTQSDWNEEGKMQVWTLENEERVNEYRAEVGLKPLESLVWENEETRENKPANFHKRREEYLAWAKKVGWRS
ncbi:MAG TPA: DUF6624 domain-containing protein [Pyrinomonadaceae bacterium]|nr:DUF6624 domain-containing protein [Pyrinomonadaceae bacterium]